MKAGNTIRQTGNGSQRTRQRQRYLVNPRFQLQYAALVATSVFAVALLVSVVLVGVLNRHVTSSVAGIVAGLERPPASNVPLVVCMFSLGLAVMVGFVSLWYTHRISGPIMIVTRWLDGLAEGRLPTIRPFRKHDEFEDLNRALQRVVDSLGTRREAECVRLREAAQMAKAALEGPAQERERTLRRLVTQLGRGSSPDTAADDRSPQIADTWSLPNQDQENSPDVVAGCDLTRSTVG